MRYDEALQYVSNGELIPIDDDLIVYNRKVDKKTIRWGIITLLYWVAWITFLIICKW